MQQQEATALSHLLEQHFGILTTGAVVDDPFAHFRAILQERIARLIEHDRDQLMSSLYRIDVEQELIETAFKMYGLAQAPWHIADLIIKRLLQKVVSWNAYHETDEPLLLQDKDKA